MAHATRSKVQFGQLLQRQLVQCATLALLFTLSGARLLAQVGAPTVTITPAGGQYAAGTNVTVQVQFCDNQGLNLSTKRIIYNGDTLRWAGVSNGVGGTGPCAVGHLATGVLTVGSTPKELWASIEDNVGLWSKWKRAEFYPPVRWISVGVTSVNPFVIRTANASSSATYTVTNKGSFPETFSLSTTVSGGVVVQPGTPASIALAAGASAPVTVNYTAPASGSGLLSLNASLGNASDGAWTDITVGNLPTLAPLALLNPSGISEKSLCVTIAVGPAAAAECGDLHLSHALPSVMTRGKVRAPVLIYSAQSAEVTPAIGALLTLPSGVSASDTVTATVVITAGPKAGNYPAGRWLASDWPAGGGTRRITATFDARDFPSGHYPYELKLQWAGGAQATAIGRLLLVNRATSSFNAGWWLAGLEQLVSAAAVDSGYMWIGGDGSTRLYKPISVGACTFVADNVEYPDTLSATGTGGACTNFVRLAPNKLRVAFDAGLRHSTTTNRIGEVTTFTYGTSGELTQITLPSGSQSMWYTFIRAGGALAQVSSPGLTVATRRITTITSVTGGPIQSQSLPRTTRITDPDASFVQFLHDPSVVDNPGVGGYKVYRRIDRRSVTTTWSYDAAGRLASSSVPANGSQTVAQSFVFAESRGRGASAVGNALEPDSAFTRLDGPLPSSADITTWWVNALGSPVRARNAMGQQSIVQYDAIWPAQAVRTVDEAHFVSTAVISPTRGLVTSITQENPFGNGNATQTITWSGHPWSLPNSVVSPTGHTTYSAYDTLATGNLLWTRVGNAPATNVTFGYNATTKQLETVMTPGAGTERLDYDQTLGNVARTISAQGVPRLIRRDLIGRESEIISPADSPADTVVKIVRQQIEYDLAGRVIRTVATAPAMPYTLTKTSVYNVPVVAETLITLTTYDAEGNATRLHSYGLPNNGFWASDPTRTTPSDTIGFGSFDLRSYDNLGRLTATSIGSGPRILSYDLAGSLVGETYMNAFVSSSYDLLGRLVTRVTPARTSFAENGNLHVTSDLNPTPSALKFPMFPNSGTSLVVPADTARYEYDATGGLRRADNRDARIRRSYWPSGALRMDELRIRGFYTGTSDGDFSQNVYNQQYQYDLAGRRTGHTLPLGDGTVAYTYDADRGLLSTVAQGYTKATFGYDNAGRQISTLISKTLGTETPGILETRSYDNDGNVTARYRRRMLNDSLINRDLWASYDARGKLKSIESYSRAYGLEWIRRDFNYSGMGAVLSSETYQGNGPQWDVEQFRTGPMGEVRHTAPTQGAGGNRYPMLASFGIDGELTGQGSIKPPVPAWRDSVYRSFDDLGNSIRSGEVRSSSNQTDYATASRMYYSADNRLRFVQRYEWARGTAPYHTRTGAWEEYRYDALGRRVFTYTRADSFDLCNYNCRSSIERTVWDGDQILYELRTDGNPNLTQLERDRNYITGLAYGKAGYVHAGGIDRPIFMTDGRVPNYNWRGMVESSSWADGAPADCSIMTGTCTTIAWSGSVGIYMKTLPGASTPNAAQWVGNVVQNGAGATGLLFRRNRSFDPTTGQFTQQDPIGVAGGRNVYGFAGGDPVNFGDPFGLCPKGMKFVKSPGEGIEPYCIDEQTGASMNLSDWIEQRNKEREEARKQRRRDATRQSAPQGCGFRGAPKCPGVDYDRPISPCTGTALRNGALGAFGGMVGNGVLMIMAPQFAMPMGAAALSVGLGAAATSAADCATQQGSP